MSSRRTGHGARRASAVRRTAAPVASLTSALVGGSGTVSRWAGQQTVTLSGANFDGTVTAYADGTPLTTTYISASSATAVLPRTYLWEIGTVAVTVKNSATAASAPQNLTVAYDAAVVKNHHRADLGRTMNVTTVSAWAEQVGGDANKNLAQATAGTQPIYVAADAAYNGKDTLNFATGRAMQSGVWATPLAQASAWILVGAPGGGATNVGIDGGDGSNRNEIISDVSNHINTNAGTSYVSAVTWSGPGVCGAVFNGSSSKLYFSAKTPLTGLAMGAQGLTKLTVGSFFGMSSVFWNGKIAELIGLSGVPSAALIAEILDYVGARYAITIGA